MYSKTKEGHLAPCGKEILPGKCLKCLVPEGLLLVMSVFTKVCRKQGGLTQRHIFILHASNMVYAKCSLDTNINYMNTQVALASRDTLSQVHDDIFKSGQD